MANRRPLALVSGRVKELPTGDNLKVGNATFDVSALSTARTVTLPDKAGTVALTSDITGGEPDVDGGSFTDTFASMTGAIDGGAGFA